MALPMEQVTAITDEDVEANIRHALKVLMAAKGLSARQLAREIGLTPATLSRRMNGGTDWKPAEIARLGNYFNRDPGVFFCTPEEFFDRMSRSGYNLDSAGHARFPTIDGGLAADYDGNHEQLTLHLPRLRVPATV